MVVSKAQPKVAGLQRYGSYVPFFRLQRSAFSAGRGERAVASYDEDSVSMAVEASRDAVRGFGGTVDRLVFATTSAPYLERLNASTIHAALNLPAAVGSFDLTTSTGSGIAALADGLDAASAGCTTLVAAADVVVGAPNGPREAQGGDGAAAIIVGPGDGVAKLIGRATRTEAVLDVWRSEGMRFSRQWEERFGEKIYTPLLAETIKTALKDAGVAAEDLTSVVVDSTNPRVNRAIPKATGILSEKFVGADLAGSVGRVGAANAGLLLTSVLDNANPGDKILVAVAADGATALLFEVTDAIAEAKPRHSVADWVASKRNDLVYTNYLKWRGVLPTEPPRRPDPERPAAPPMLRAEEWKYAFVGSRCTGCGTVNLPPQRVCVACQAVDENEPVPCADVECQVATYTIDRLAYSLQPPVVAAVVDFSGGGRLTCQLTDVDPESVAMGDQLEMTFRRFFTAGGVHNYFWKARPRR